MKRRIAGLSILTLLLVLAGVYVAYAWTALPVVDDPLVRMPGTQPGQTALETPTRCLNCHAGYDTAVEPGFNWKGSMMAQAARDFLYWACLTVAGQDSVWAVGTPNAVDICERCHFPKGWLEGRSDPPNASAMIGADYDGVQCDFCHTMYDPFFEATYQRQREGDLDGNGVITDAEWQAYWDETNASGTPSQPAANATYTEDTVQAQAITQFNGNPFFSGNVPVSPNYTENGSGQYFVSSGSQKRASFADAAARHQMFYSRYHKSKYFCNVCHDVSNPVLANLAFIGTVPGDGTTVLTTESQSAYSYLHVERTFSEFMLSAYGQEGGAATNLDFQLQGAPDITTAAKCQDCHMRDVVGVAANKNGVPVRPNESIEHPNSGQPLHDLTGGNAWVSAVLASIAPNNPNIDQYNFDRLVNKINGALTLDVNQGEGLDYNALVAGVDRSKQQLLLAATIKNLAYDSVSGNLTFRVQNNTAHKLISGFPEGRRMFVNIKAYAGGSLAYEVNPYDATVGTLKGLPTYYSPNSPALGANEAYVDELVYEMHPTSSDTVPDAEGLGLTGELETFHFALATGRYKDNRIPPKGFDVANADARKSLPVWHGEREDPAALWIYTSEEYLGGYDQVTVNIPVTADTFEINLYYQTTSREYIEFLRDEINGSATTLSSPTPSGETNAYIVQSDPFFAGLVGWGDTIWDLWTHNMNLDGAKPFLMTSAVLGTPPTSCTAPTPTLVDPATVGNGQVTLTWSDESANGAAGYNVYYDQAGKAQPVASAVQDTTYTDTGLQNGVEYCYKVTAYDATCESGFSNIVCATPNNQGQNNPVAGVVSMEVGYWSGKGKTPQWTLSPIPAGQTVVIRTLVTDAAGAPIANATVEVVIGGPESVTLNSGPSDNQGWAEASWNTKAPSRKQPGTTPGIYTATVNNVTASGYLWDSVMLQATFEIQ